jgi:ribosomal protein L11 methyltransferase
MNSFGSYNPFNMEYLEIRVHDIPSEQQDILTFLLAEAGFESFAQEGDELQAYIPSNLYDRNKVKQIFKEHNFDYSEAIIPEKNWNEEWERNFSPVEIAGKCFIRAPFHPSQEVYQYEIIIEPKMSFGTAHHETTSQMIELMLDMDFRGKQVLDMGCGTGILAILADKMGAAGVLAVDNDSWAFNNSVENIEKNSSSHITVKLGGIDEPKGDFDIILANINRNILLDQIFYYAKMLNSGGYLLMSGFYEEDLPMIRECASINNLEFENYIMKNRWVAAKFIK